MLLKKEQGEAGQARACGLKCLRLSVHIPARQDYTCDFAYRPCKPIPPKFRVYDALGTHFFSLEPLSSPSPARKIEKKSRYDRGNFMAIFGGSTPCPRRLLEIVAAESPRNVVLSGQ